jgi:septal ring factor EnvC (AmiA/AmiB activator)
MRNSMRHLRCCVLVLLLTGAARAADDIKPQDLKKMYDDTLAQLKTAQDRKAQLAADNAKLTARIAELEKQTREQSNQIDELKLQIISFADRTYFLRSHYAAWLEFLEIQPGVKTEWDMFLENLPPVGPTLQTPLLDPNWPLTSGR